MTAQLKFGDQLATRNQNNLSYRDAGVDIDAGNALVERIKPLAASTSRPGTVDGLGGFGALFDLKQAGYNDPLLVSATDGVGTKLKIAIESGIHDSVGIDLVAMCVNDLVVQGAEPLFFLDYFASGALSVDHAADVVSGIAEGCKRAGAALIGGETAELPGLYADGDYDLAGFAVGAVERADLLPRPTIMSGDALIGLQSNGVHSNGFSLVRKIAEKKELIFSDPCPFNPSVSLGEALLAPTRIYVKPCLAAISTGHVKALAHITGGGLTENLPRALPSGFGARIDLTSWTVPSVFRWLSENGPVDRAEMLRTFNCGIGMVLIVAEEHADSIADLMNSAGEQVIRIGEIASAADAPITYTGQSDLC